MNLLDIRTVMFSQLITDAVCTALLTFLWLQNRKRYAGMFFWVVDFIFQTTAILLIILRGSIPDWVSIGLSSPLVVVGALMGYLGLERFVGKRSSQVHNYVVLAVFILSHIYFVFVHPDLEARNLNISLGLFVLCAQCAWLLLRRARSGLTRTTQAVGWVFALFCLVSLIRIFVVLAIPERSNDFFQSGFYDTLTLMAYQVLLILLTFGLALMVNRQLLNEVKTQEEKFAKVFHSSPDGILITRLSDGLILNVNRGFEEITGYLPSEAIGRSTLDLPLWVKETDRQQVVAELSARGEMQGREFQFRRKSGRELTGLFYAEILVVDNEQLILSSMSDITERKRAEEDLQALSARQKALLVAIPDIIMEVDVHKVYTWANHAGLDFFGEDVIGREAAVYFEGEQSTYEGVKPLFNGSEDVVYIESWQRRKDGQKRLLAWWCRVLKDEQGNVTGALSSARDITEQRHWEEALRESEDKFKYIFDYSVVGNSITLPAGEVHVNQAFCEMLGYSLEELQNKKWQDITHPDDIELTQREMDVLLSGEKESARFTKRFLQKNGSVMWADVSSSVRRDKQGKPLYFMTTLVDITERMRAEETIRSLARFPAENPNPVMRVARDANLLYANDAAFALLKDWKLEVGKPVHEVLKDPICEVLETQTARTVEIPYEEHTFSITFAPAPENEYVNLYGRDITQVKQAEEALRESETNFRALAENAGEGVLIAGEGGVHLFANRASMEITGYSVDELLHLNMQELAHPDEAPEIMEKLQKRLAGKTTPTRYETNIISKHGLKIPVEISSNKTVWKGQPADIVFMEDITARKLAEGELHRTLEELKRSNSELEQFAYVASHDLQEPLRMVSSYVQLLERRYKGKLDKDADEFIGFAVDGAERMQRLINDLLAYSRVGTRGQPFAPASSETALGQALESLQLSIQENKARITHDPLPQVIADETQLVQLFQNLIGNAIKFHGEKKPRVHVSVGRQEKEWVFSVRDNGIGIEPQYADRIFIIFQRLNSREKYAGTGIGLAMCKKIVQRHGGRIWVESQPGKGATFYFTLPKTEGELS